MAIRLQVRRDTSTNWSTNNPILQVGEFGFDITVNRFKVGIASNETSRWNVLPYLNVIPSELKELAQDFVEEAITAGTGITKSYNDSANTLTIAVDNTIANKTYVDTAVSGLSSTSATTYIPLSLLGQVDGVAELDQNGFVPDAQLPAGITRDTELSSAISTAISNLIDTAPDALNTLNELAAAINDDASYAATVTTALGLKAPIASPTFTGTVAGIDKTMVGLANVDNTTDALKPVSTATQTALNLKLNLSEPAVDYYITNAGMGSYLINGVSNGTIHFERGKKYRILVNAPGHPFWIQTVSGGYSVNDLYSTGISGAGTDNGSILVELPSNAPQLYYACQYHPSMAGSIFTGNVNQTYKSLSGLSNVDNTSDNTKALITYIPVSSATRTISSATDKNTLIECSVACTITIPNDTQDAGWPVGSMVEIRQVGTGQVTITKDAAVTMNGTDAQFKSRVQWSTIMLEKRSANSWLVTGDTTA